jgi:hypothetical protein
MAFAGNSSTSWLPWLAGWASWITTAALRIRGRKDPLTVAVGHPDGMRRGLRRVGGFPRRATHGPMATTTKVRTLDRGSACCVLTASHAQPLVGEVVIARSAQERFVICCLGVRPNALGPGNLNSCFSCSHESLPTRRHQVVKLLSSLTSQGFVSVGMTPKWPVSCSKAAKKNSATRLSF